MSTEPDRNWMKRLRIGVAVVAGLVWLGVLVPTQRAVPQETVAQFAPPRRVKVSEALINRLPPDWRGPAKAYWVVWEGTETEILKLSDEDLRGRVVQSLSFEPGAESFVLDHLPEPLPQWDRRIAIDNMPWQDHWVANGRVDSVLEQMVVSEPDHELALAALESARELKMRRLRQLLAKRLESSKRNPDSEEVKKLEEEEERWISLQKGTMLPTFLRQVPPLFSVKAAGQPVRVVAFGDFGFGAADPKFELSPADQQQVAAAMLEYHRRKPFDFGITLGDNFYADGMHSADDPRWQTWWEDLYGALKIKFYPVLGNHDWYHPDSPAAEILYSERSPTWSLPAPYYTYTAGPVQFFALDTDDISRKQLRWLQEELENSRAAWKVVYGHFPIPIFVASPHASLYVSLQGMVKEVLPILKKRTDIYLAGHHHSLQHLKPEGGVHFVISGAGGATAYPVDEKAEIALFARSVHGFTVLEADAEELTFRHIGADGEELYTYALRKEQPP